MTLLALLMGLLYPACAKPGTEGLPAPMPIEPAAIVRPRSPNTALAGPAGFAPIPDLVAPVFPLSAPSLYRALREVAARQPGTTLQAAYDDRLQAQYVVRSPVMNFPDLVMVQAIPAGPATSTASTPAGSSPSPTPASTVVIWSRSVYGWGDMGANRRRVAAWLAALAALPATTGAGSPPGSQAGGPPPLPLRAP